MNKLIILVVLACVLGSLAQSSNDKGSQCKFYEIFEQRSGGKCKESVSKRYTRTYYLCE